MTNVVDRAARIADRRRIRGPGVPRAWRRLIDHARRQRDRVRAAIDALRGASAALDEQRRVVDAVITTLATEDSDNEVDG